MSKLTIKQFYPVPADFSVLEPRDEDGAEIWHDYSRDGMVYFWAVIDGGEDDDYIQLLSFNSCDGDLQEASESIVVPRDNCPECGTVMEPHVDQSKVGSFIRHVCPNCGHGLRVRPMY